MKQVSTLFDALRNEKFAVAVKDGQATRYYGVEGAGREWAQWANSADTKSLESSQLPAGVIQGPFKNTNDYSLKSLINSLGYAEQINSNSFESKAYSFKSSYSVENGARVPAVMDTPISHFTTNQYSSAVEYKALTMRTQIKEGSFLLEARSNGYAFNFDTYMYNAAPSKAEIKSLRQRLDNNLGRSSERRLGIKLKNAITQTSGRKLTGVIHELEVKSLSDSIETKGIGQRIGGASRLGRRTARGVTANFDPKAWDGDGDGIVQEGTPFQRPAVPGVNDRSTGGKVNATQATEAWEKLETGKRGQVAKRTIVSKPAPRPGLASRTQASSGDNVSKEVTDMVKEVLSKKSNSADLRSLVRGLGPDGTNKLSKNQEDRINGHIDAFDNGDYENNEDFMSDIANVLQNRPSTAQKPGQSGMRSRVSTARTQRQVDGLASRSSRSKKKSKLKATPGVDKVEEKDGQLWESLTPEQKEIVLAQTKQAYADLMDEIKTRDSDWWNSFISQTSRLKSRQKTDSDGNPWSSSSRIAGEAFTAYSIEMEDSIDERRREISNLESDLANAKSSMADDKEIKKIENKIKKQTRELDNAQKTLDDLKTFDQMQKADNWSLLEHLHPEVRQKIFGKKVPAKQKDNYKDVFEGSKSPASLSEPSTIFEEVGGVRKKKSIIGEKGDAKLAELARRVTRPNPERQRRREVRKQKKAGRSGFDISREEEKPSKVKTRIAKTKRSIKRRLKKDRDAKKVLQDIKKGQSVRLFERDADGKVVLGTDTVELLNQVFNEVAKASRGKFKDQDGANMLLAFLWENNGYNRTPATVSRDEAIGLIDEGWFPVKRGVNTESFATDYLFDPVRFITGQNGEAEGPGEYWAQAQSTSWDSYWSNTPSGMMALLSPDYRMFDGDKRNEYSRTWGKFSDPISGVIKTFEKGEAEKLDPADFLRELMSQLPVDGSPEWSSEVGQMWSSLLDAYRSSDGEEKAKIWNIMEYMSMKIQRHDSWQNYIPMILGYDGIDTGGNNSARVGGSSNGKQVLIFNRQGLAAVDEVQTLTTVKEILTEAGK